ncbi:MULTISPECIES: phage tail tip lysozyme [unclassified Sinorhizobium]|uniref:phage tail tip lysozyme n=1 Tax=unclassified Sinorhizobium TaxID=2613772 RepID=UPI0024C2CC81|nr:MULTISPECIES: phage tail tip lysozyme [unclassified Sinorhizobium]MDK1373353.1 phage tail tip lysozyme [Sinorhizobium sp. 6-70]MDK1481176.1 phage tail tip lysozyme [Sinorhizobium sp. 6-117]
MRDAMDDFDDRPTIDPRRMTEIRHPDNGRPRPFAPEHAPLVEPVARAPMDYRGALTGMTRFVDPAVQLPVDHFQKLKATDILSDNLAARLKRDLQQRLKMREEQAAAIVGNADHESGGFGRTFGNLWQNGRVNKDAFGHMQWDGSRKRDFFEWADENGLDRNSYEANYGFMEHEFKEGKEFDKGEERLSLTDFYATPNVDDATEVLARGYLRPNPEKLQLRKRQAGAKNAMKLPDYQNDIPYDFPPWRTPVPAPRPDIVEGKPWRY